MKTLDIDKEFMRGFAYDFVKNTFSLEKHLKTLENTLEEVVS